MSEEYPIQIDNLQHVITEYYCKYDDKNKKDVYIISSGSMEKMGRRNGEIVFLKNNRVSGDNGEYSGANVSHGYLRKDIINGIIDNRRNISIYNIKYYTNSYKELVEKYPEYLI